MPLRRKRLERQETPPALEFVPPPEPWPGWPAGWSTSWGVGTDALALRSTIVFRCVDIIAGAICSLPLGQFLSDRTPVEPPASWVDNPQPELYSSRRDAISAIVVSALMRGNVYLYTTARYYDGYPQSWVVLNPDRIQVSADPYSGLPTYSVDGMRIPSADIRHIRYQTRPGELLGFGPLSAVTDNLLALAAGTQWAGELLGKGMMPQGVLHYPDNLSETQTDEIRESWEAKPGLVRVLSGGLAFEPLSITPKDSMLLERMDFDARQIATAFGIPAQMVNLAMESSGLHYSSSEMDIRALWQLCLNPIADNIERAFSTMLPGRQFVEFDEYGYLSGNFSEQVAAATALVSSGIWTVDDARKKFGLPPLPETPEPTSSLVPSATVLEQPPTETPVPPALRSVGK